MNSKKKEIVTLQTSHKVLNTPLSKENCENELNLIKKITFKNNFPEHHIQTTNS